jgi:hypothetical protein
MSGPEDPLDVAFVGADVVRSEPPEGLRVVGKASLHEGGVRPGIHYFPGTITAEFTNEELIAKLDFAPCGCRACQTWVCEAVMHLKARGYTMAGASIPTVTGARALGLPSRLKWVTDAHVRERYEAIFEEALTGRVEPRFHWRIVRDLWLAIDHLTGRAKL